MLELLLYAASCAPPLPLLPGGDASYLIHLWHGILIGICIAIPVGPIAFVCIQYALHRGFAVALSAGVGAALADASFGLLAGMGFTLATDWFILNSCWLQFFGGIFLCLLGARFYFVQASHTITINQQASYLSAFGSTYFLTLANPLTVLAFMALFGYFGLNDLSYKPAQASVTIFGIFVGSLLWWALLIYGISRLRPYCSTKTLHTLRRISGLILFACGFIAMMRASYDRIFF